MLFGKVTAALELTADETEEESKLNELKAARGRQAGSLRKILALDLTKPLTQGRRYSSIVFPG